MKTSTERILTTHVGSLPRPPDLLEFLEARETGRPFEQAAFDACLSLAVREIVEKQVAAGIDSVCDGELGKISYTFYVRHRLSGITAFRGGEVERPPQTAAHRDLLDHPDFMQRLNAARGGTAWFSREAVPCCTGPVAYANRSPLEIDLQNLAAACAAVEPAEAFMNAASPGVLTKFVPDRYYRDEDAYVDALANALKEEYEAITGAGFILQIDAPDLGSARHNQYQHLSDVEFLRIARAQYRRAQPRDRQHPAASDAHAPVLGQLRRSAYPRHPASQDPRRVPAGAAGRVVVRGGQSAPCA